MKCKKCDSDNLAIQKKGSHWELFCKDCLEFQTFLNKRKAQRFLVTQKNHE